MPGGRPGVLREYGIEEHQILDIAIDLSLAHDADRRDAKALLENCPADGGLAPGNHATDIGVMGNVGDIGDDLTAMEYRRQDVDVGQVGAAPIIGVVGDEHISWVDVLLGETILDRRHRTDHRAEVDRYAMGLCDDLAFTVKDRRRAVPTLLDIGRERHTHQGHSHLLGGCQEMTGDDLGGDWINRVLHGTASSGFSEV